MRHKHTLFPRRPVSKMVVIPKAGKMLILSGKLITPFDLRDEADIRQMVPCTLLLYQI